MKVSERVKNLQQYIESHVPGVKIISASKDKLNVEFTVIYKSESTITFTVELNILNGVPSFGRNNLPVFLPAVVVPRIQTFGVCESLQLILDLLNAYVLRKMQVEELQRGYGKYIIGKVKFTLPCTYIEFIVHVRSHGEGMLCLGLYYSLLGILPESIKAHWKVVKGPVEEMQNDIKEESKVFLEKELEEAFPLVFECKNE